MALEPADGLREAATLRVHNQVDGPAAALTAAMVEELRAGDTQHRAWALPARPVERVLVVAELGGERLEWAMADGAGTRAPELRVVIIHDADSWADGSGGGRDCRSDCSWHDLRTAVLEMPDVDGVELVEGGSGKREVGDAVDLPWQAARGLEQGLDRGRLEQRQFAAGQVQPVQQVGLKFVAQQTAEVVSHDDTLAGVALFSWTPKIAWIGRGCSLERRGQGGPKR